MEMLWEEFFFTKIEHLIEVLLNDVKSVISEKSEIGFPQNVNKKSVILHLGFLKNCNQKQYPSLNFWYIFYSLKAVDRDLDGRKSFSVFERKKKLD